MGGPTLQEQLASLGFEEEPLSDHKRDNFSCGKPPLDHYFHSTILKDKENGFASPYVHVRTTSREIVGYYTLSNHQVHRDLVSATLRKKAGYDYIPATLIGRLANDERIRGCGYGALLLKCALSRCVTLTSQSGSALIVVDTIDDEARGFYRHHEFRAFEGVPERLYITMGGARSVIAPEWKPTTKKAEPN